MSALGFCVRIYDCVWQRKVKKKKKKSFPVLSVSAYMLLNTPRLYFAGFVDEADKYYRPERNIVIVLFSLTWFFSYCIDDSFQYSCMFFRTKKLSMQTQPTYSISNHFHREHCYVSQYLDFQLFCCRFVLLCLCLVPISKTWKKNNSQS